MQRISKSHLSRIAQLKQKKFRDSADSFLISGLNAVRTALESPTLKVHEILLHEDRKSFLDLLPDEKSHWKSCSIYHLTERQFQQISDEKNPQGIALVAHKPRPLSLTKIQEESPLLYLDQINDPGNLGTILRTAAWFGLTSVLFSPDSADPYQPKVVRASAGLIAHVHCYEKVAPDSVQRLKKKAGYHLLGATSTAQNSILNYRFRPEKKYLIIFGSEAKGISKPLAEQLDQQIAIPCHGFGESLNLASAVAIFLFQFRKSISEIGDE